MEGYRQKLTKAHSWREIHEMTHTQDAYEGAYTQGYIGRSIWKRQSWKDTKGRAWRDMRSYLPGYIPEVPMYVHTSTPSDENGRTHGRTLAEGYARMDIEKG